MLSANLRAAFVDACPGDAATLPDLEPVLAAHLEEARAAWPDLTYPQARFLADLALLCPDGAALRAVRASDVYLARACAAGEAAALAAFESTYFDEVDLAGRRVRATPALVDEVKGDLRRVLFVHEGARPAATSEYRGQGDLRGWIRVSATRALLHALKQARRQAGIADSLLPVLAPAADPELVWIRDLYREAFGDAFRAALSALTVRERALLRYHVIDGLTVAQIGRLYGVHGTSISRWTAKARAALLEHTRAELSRRLGAPGDEVDSIIRLLQSRMDVSFGPAS